MGGRRCEILSAVVCVNIHTVIPHPQQQEPSNGPREDVLDLAPIAGGGGQPYTGTATRNPGEQTAATMWWASAVTCRATAPLPALY